MATYSMKVSGSIATIISATNANVYTCPANSYAIINLYCDYASGSHRVLVGGRNAYRFQAGGAFQTPGATANVTTVTFSGSHQIYVGPGQVVSTIQAGVGDIEFTGVQFTN